MEAKFNIGDNVRYKEEYRSDYIKPRRVYLVKRKISFSDKHYYDITYYCRENDTRSSHHHVHAKCLELADNGLQRAIERTKE